MEIYLAVLSAVSFLVFGSACHLSSHMQREFTRYGIPQFRKLVGTLQILGAVGLLVGFMIPWIGVAAAAGLAVLMLLGVITRIRIRDTWPQMTPAAFYMILNAWIAIAGY